jgi:hypothetical protein
MTGVYYNTAAVIDADGSYLGKYRKAHIPQVAGFWEKFYFRPGNLGYPVFATAYGKVGVYICYDRHFPDGARCLGLNGAEIVFNPSATVAGLSQHLWESSNPRARGQRLLRGGHQRVGTEAPGTSAGFMARPISPTRAARSSPRPAKTGTKWSSRNSTSTWCGKSATPGSFSATAGRKPTAS